MDEPNAELHTNLEFIGKFEFESNLVDKLKLERKPRDLDCINSWFRKSGNGKLFHVRILAPRVSTIGCCHCCQEIVGNLVCCVGPLFDSQGEGALNLRYLIYTRYHTLNKWKACKFLEQLFRRKKGWRNSYL